MTDENEHPEESPGAAARCDSNEPQPYIAQPEIPVDPSLIQNEIDPSLHNTSATIVPLVDPAMVSSDMANHSNPSPNASKSIPQRPIASLDFTNEPFDNDQAQQDWLKATIGENSLHHASPPMPENAALDASGHAKQTAQAVTDTDTSRMNEDRRDFLGSPVQIVQQNKESIASEIPRRPVDGGQSQTRTAQNTVAHTVAKSADTNRQPPSHYLDKQRSAASEPPQADGSAAEHKRDGPSSHANVMPGVSIQRPGVEAFYRRTTAHIGFTYDNTDHGAEMIGQTYVEKLEPLRKVCSIPLILVHGDFHTSQTWLTKPDGNPGWTSYFLNRGYEVYLIDLPPGGRSTWLDYETAKLMPHTRASVEFVENDLTAPSKKSVGCWPTAAQHSQWPGSGLKGDPVFDRYYATLTPLLLARPERQVLARDALVQLLHKIGASVLIGEGTGATAAWLAADYEPDLVKGVVAIEPAGPPFGTTCKAREDGRKFYDDVVEYNPGIRPYGISDAPLAFYPLPNPDLSLTLDALEINSKGQPLDVAHVTAEEGDHGFLLQDPGKTSNADNDSDQTSAQVSPRQLTNLKKMKHAIFTAHASSHSTYDRATCLFLEQAGVEVKHLTLASAGIFGNGHLMFLEKNSDRLAGMVNSCMKLSFPGLQEFGPNAPIASQRMNGHQQIAAPGSSATQTRVAALNSGNGNRTDSLDSFQPRSAAQMRAQRSEKLQTRDFGLAAPTSAPQNIPSEATPSRPSKRPRLTITSGDGPSQMQQQIQSEHFQRSLAQNPHGFTATLARNPGMPSPSQLHAFAQNIPGAIQVNMPQGRRLSFGQQQSMPTQMQNSMHLDDGIEPIEMGSRFSSGQTPSILPPQFNLNHPGQVAQLQELPQLRTQPRAAGQLSHSGFGADQTAVAARTPTPQRSQHQPTGNTTVGMSGSGWNLQSPTTPTPAPRTVTAANDAPQLVANDPPVKAPKAAGNSAKKSSTKPKKTLSEMEDDEDYDPSPKPSKARGGRSGAASKKGTKAKNVINQDASVVPEASGVGGSKGGRATKAKGTKRNTPSAEVPDNEPVDQGVLATETKSTAQKTTSGKRKRKDADDGEGEADEFNGAKRTRARAPSREGKADV